MQLAGKERSPIVMPQPQRQTGAECRSLKDGARGRPGIDLQHDGERLARVC